MTEDIAAAATDDTQTPQSEATQVAVVEAPAEAPQKTAEEPKAASQDKTFLDEDEDEEKTLADKQEEKTDEKPMLEIKAPEGYVLADETMAHVLEKFQAAGVTQEQVDALMPLHTELLAKAMERQAQAQVDILRQQNTEWMKSLKEDEQFGGAQYQANRDLAIRTLKKFGDEELVDMVKGAGLASYPPLVKFLHRVGSAMSEDAMPDGKPRTIAVQLYPNSPGMK